MRAPNTLPTVSASLNPAMDASALLGQLADTAFERIFVLCFNHTCDAHTSAGVPGRGRVWWQSIQDKVTIFDGHIIDRQHKAIFDWAGCTQRKCPVSRTKLGSLAKHGAKHQDLKLWRDGSFHRLAALISHLALVEQAAKLNLSNVLILEADFVRAVLGEQYMTEKFKFNQSHTSSVAARVSAALSIHPWSIMRLSFSVNKGVAWGESRDENDTVVGITKCTRQCVCQEWSGTSLWQGLSKAPKMCVVPASWLLSNAPNARLDVRPTGANGSTMQSAAFMSSAMPPFYTHRLRRHEYLNQIRDYTCDLRDSAAYAVHHTAYEPFLALLHELRSKPLWLKNEVLEVPFIDIWLPHRFDNLYVLPQLVAQQSRTVAGWGADSQRDGIKFEKYCHRSVGSMTEPSLCYVTPHTAMPRNPTYTACIDRKQ